MLILRYRFNHNGRQLPDIAVLGYNGYRIGATNAFAFDLQAACSSFLYGMSVASAYVQSDKKVY
jgi:3-oxoacyl-[acyl-carrier-protein] synthase-3